MDCGCGGGSNCITKHKKEFKKWVKAELKRLDCGCGCKGQKAFEEKYGKLVGGKLTACPAGWRDDGLTCVKNCDSGDKDDGLTCRKPCPPGFIDDGLTCRKPITSSMNDCPPGSKDIWGTCWGPVRKDCVHDCFKHPSPGCRTWQCGRLEWAGIDWGPKLCTSCNLECGKTCWDVWGITKQLHERELRISGGEVEGKSIYGKEIRSKIDWEGTGKEFEHALKEVFGDDSALAKAFDPEKNGVAESFRKFGKDSKEAFDDIGRKLKKGFEQAITPEFRLWLKRHEKAWTTAFRRFFPPEFEEQLKDPRFWIEVAIIIVEISAAVIAASATVASMGAAAPVATAVMVTAINMLGPSLRMIVKASNGEPIDANDISQLVLSAIPPAGKNSAAASSYLGKMFQFVQRNKDSIATGASILNYGINFAHATGYSPVSTCLVNCPTHDDRPFPPPDNPNPISFPPSPDAPPQGQKTDAELLAMAPGNRPFTKFLTDGPEVNPDYVGTPKKWINQKRRELYNYPPPSDVTGPAGNLETKQDQQNQALTDIPKNETPEFIQSQTTASKEAELNGFGRFIGGAIENQPLIEAEIVDGEYVNPMGMLTSNPESSGKEPPKGPGACEFNPKCYAQNYPDLFEELDRDEKNMTDYWTDVGKEQGHNPCCGAKLVIGQNYEERHAKCNARNGYYDRETKKCDITKNIKGIKKTTNQYREDNCKADGSYWEKGQAAHRTTQVIDNFITTQKIHTDHPAIPAGCHTDKNLQGKNKVQEAARQQAEANKRTIDRIVKEDFHPECYAANNPDVVQEVGNTPEALEKHFREFGIDQQRSSKCGEDLKHLKEAANKAKALEGFNAYCYAYNNPKVFEEVGKSYFEKMGTLQREHPEVLAQQLKQHFSDVGYEQRLDYSCVPRDTEYNWECFAENMRTIPGTNYARVNFNDENTVNRYWDTQKNVSWETFNKGACLQKDLKKAKEIRLFNAKCYAFNNPELILKFGRDDAAYLKHFIDEGFDQGLDPSCDVRNETFKPECYGYANPDLNTTDVNALTNHWNSHGKNEWRGINCTSEQAEVVFKHQYCQDTESYWDGANCDVTRHTNGTSKEQISNEVINAVNVNNSGADYYSAEYNDVRQYNTFQERQNSELLEIECKKCNGFVSSTRILGIYDKCDCNRFPNGDPKSKECHEQNEYYDEITHLCDPNRVPSGLTIQEEETRLQEEELARIHKENIEFLEQLERERLEREKRENVKVYFDEKLEALIYNQWKPIMYNTGNLVTLQVSINDDLDTGWKIYEKNGTKGNMTIVKSRPDALGRDLWIERPDLSNVGKLDEFLQPTINLLNERKEILKNITDPKLLKEVIDCHEFSKQYNTSTDSYYNFDSKKCLIINNSMKECLKQNNNNCLPKPPKPTKPITEPVTEPVIEQQIPERIIEQPVPERIVEPKTAEPYNNSKVYQVGDLVTKDGIEYKMIDSIGAAGYEPPRPTNWQVISESKPIETLPKPTEPKPSEPEFRGQWISSSYGPNVTVISPINGNTYISKKIVNNVYTDPSNNLDEWELYDEAPQKPVELLPKPTELKPSEPYNNSKIYQLGDVVTKDGVTYKMIDSVGMPGYAPPRPTNWEPVITGSSKPASLTLYWADWCPHCHDLMPEWKKLGNFYKGIKIQALEEQQTNFQVDGYPTIIFRNGSNIEKYEGKRTKTAIINFLKKKLSKK